MDVSRIIFEHGLEIGPARNSVKMATEGLSLVQIFASMREHYHVRPVLLTETIHGFGEVSRERHAVLTLDGLDQLNLRVSLLSLPQGLPKPTYSSLLRPMMNIQYMADALIYHLQELAILYSQICERAVQICQFGPEGEAGENEPFLFQGQSEPYHEIEALITAARRMYDALRYILWKVFGPGGKDTPSNFSKTIRACHSLPKPLRSSLESSWDLYGVKMTAYRDCIQHYVPVTFGIQSAFLEKGDSGSWSVRLRLPDNPQMKSQSAFKFIENLDALTYGWELVNEVFKVAAEVFAAIPHSTIASPE